VARIASPIFWQGNHGKKIDCLLVNDEKVASVEIKSGKKMSIQSIREGPARKVTVVPK
jgi:hypothetical protein